MRWRGVASMLPSNFDSNLVLGLQSERGVGLGWNWEKLTLNAFQLVGKRKDEKFEIGFFEDVCAWRKIEKCRRRKKIKVWRKAGKEDEESGYLWKNGWMRKKEEKIKLKKEKKTKGHTWVG